MPSYEYAKTHRHERTSDQRIADLEAHTKRLETDLSRIYYEVTNGNVTRAEKAEAEVERLDKEKAFLQADKHNLEGEVARLRRDNEEWAAGTERRALLSDVARFKAEVERLRGLLHEQCKKCPPNLKAWEEKQRAEKAEAEVERLNKCMSAEVRRSNERCESCAWITSVHALQLTLTGMVKERDEALMSAECSRGWRMHDRAKLMDRANAAEAEVERLSKEKAFLQADVHNSEAHRNKAEAEVARLTEENAALVRDSARLRLDNAALEQRSTDRAVIIENERNFKLRMERDEYKMLADHWKARRDEWKARAQKVENERDALLQSGAVAEHWSQENDKLRMERDTLAARVKELETTGEWEIYSRTHHTDEDFCCGRAMVAIPGPGTFRVTVEKKIG